MVNDASQQIPHADISVILCVRNGAATIRDQLDALGGQITTFAWELVVVDNGSSDATVEIVRAWQNSDGHRDIQIIDASSAIGLGAARNVGAKAAAGRLLLFCDADDVADSGWLQALGDALASADMVGGPLEYRMLNHPSTLSWQKSSRAEFTETLPGSPDMPYAIGANMAVRADCYAEVGGCDERFVAAWDDIDLSLRVAGAGKRLAAAPDAVMHYRLRPDVRAAMSQARRYGRGEGMVRVKFGRSGPLPPIDRSWLRSVSRSLLRRPAEVLTQNTARRERLLVAAYQAGLVAELAGVHHVRRSDRPSMPQYRCRETLALIRGDVGRARMHRGASWKRLLFPQVTAVALHRVAHALRESEHGYSAMGVYWVNQWLTGADIDPSATIGPRLHIAHTHGVVIGPARLGADVTLSGANIIGARETPENAEVFPQIGDRVTLYARSTILGGVTIGDDAVIGAHALVLIDVPAGKTAIGMPAVVRSNSRS